MLGFMILASMLFISGAISIFELTKLGKSIKGLIVDNYQSIDFSRNMLDALEQQGTALLLLSNGDEESAVKEFNAAENFFYHNLDSASISFKVEMERTFVDSVRISYSAFNQVARNALNQSDFTLTRYLTDVKPLMLEVDKHVKNLITLNQQGLFNSALFFETSAHRASIPGLIVIITSLIFTFVFTFLVHHYFVSPIIRLTKGINDFVKYRKPFDVQLETKDEFHSLRESIVSLISILQISTRKIE